MSTGDVSMRKKATDRIDILIVSPDLLESYSQRGGGIEKNDLQIARTLSPDYYVTIIGPCHCKDEVIKSDIENVTFQIVNFKAMGEYPLVNKKDQFWNFMRVLLYCIPLTDELLNIIMRHKSIILIVHNGFPGLCASILGRLSGRKILYSEGNLTPWTKTNFKPRKIRPMSEMMRIINLNTGKIIAALSIRIRVQSELIEEGMIEQGIDRGKISIIPIGISPRSLCLKSNTPRNADGFGLHVGFIGRLCLEKNVDFLCDIIEINFHEEGDIKFIILGDGPLKSRIKDLPNVDFRGWINESSLVQELMDFDLVICTQMDLGIAEIESLARGKIIIAGKVGNIVKILTDGENGALCNLEPRAFIRTIRMIDQNPEMKNRISVNAFKLSKEIYDQEVVDSAWRKLLDEMTGESS